MKIVIDTHTHSIASGHAYSTVQELAKGAYEKGIEAFAMTDHGPAMKGAPHIYHFGNLRVIPELIGGVRIVKGAESNIIDFKGSIDIPSDYIDRLEFLLASFHDICIKPGTVEEHTEALCGALKNTHIDAIAHPGNPQYPIDIDRVVKAAAELGKLIEINNSSFTVRTGSAPNCAEIVRKCKKYGTRITCGSDAHISFDVGRFDYVKRLLEDEKFPEELLIGSSMERFLAYLEERKSRIGQAGQL
jgi:putative hydrolase